MTVGTVNQEDLVPTIRDASRELVREWGFLRPTLADSGLSPTAVHCLIEIGDFGVRTFAELHEVLRVHSSELGRTIGELDSSGDIRTSWRATETGGVEQVFEPTGKGLKTLAAVNAWSHEQVLRALAATPPDAADKIIEAFKLYASALRSAQTEAAPALAPVSLQDSCLKRLAETTIALLPGYRSGILGRCVEMNMDYFSRFAGCGDEMEIYLANELGDLLKRISKPVNEVFAAVETAPGENSQGQGRIVGTIWMDGEDLGLEGVVHLRAFILDGKCRGRGVGQALLKEAMAFAERVGFMEVRLWTLRQLTVARRMYEKAGFVEVGNSEVGAHMFAPGFQVMEYCWKKPGSDAV